MPVPEKKTIEIYEDEYNELLEKVEFLTQECKKLSAQNIQEEREAEERRMEELDQFREATLTWWHTIEQTMKMYEASLGNEYRLRHEREKLLKEIAELREQVGIIGVYDVPKEDQ